MAQKVVTDAKGLKTYKNELSLDDGSMITANNVVIDRDNVVEPRRGFGLYGEEFDIDDNKRAKQLLQYKKRLILHYDSNLMYDDGNGNWSQFSGTFNELDTGLRIKGIESNGNYYITTSSGIKKLSATKASEFSTDSDYIYDAGAAKGLDGQATADLSIAGFFSAQSVIAYRIVWGYKDVNDNLVLGSPSEIITVRNLATTSAICELTFTIPEEVLDNSKYFYQIYRSPIQDDSTSPGSATAEDELNLVFEDFPTSTDFTNGYVTTTDITPEDFRDGGAPLYTNPVSGDTILQANEKPPVCTDLAQYRGSIFFANTKTRHQKEVALISAALLNEDDTLIIGNNSETTTYTFKTSVNDITSIPTGTAGLDYDIEVVDHGYSAGDTVYIYNTNSTPSIDGVYLVQSVTDTDNFQITYPVDVTTAGDEGYAEKPGDSEDIASKHVYLARTGSVSQNIDDTARSLVRVINRNSGTVYAYYISGETDVPGMILLEARDLTDVDFYIKVGAGVSGKAFNPTLPETETELSSNQESPNRIYFSKTNIPEAVPMVNFFDVGGKDSPIVRIAALRDSLIIFKTDGIYRLSGTDTANFTVALQDSSALIIAADSLGILNNEIYLVTTQGVVRVGESAVPNVISRDIESDIIQPSNITDFNTSTFGLSYESDRSYMLFIPTIENDTTATQCYRFNVFTNTWVRWDVAKTCGIVLKNDDKVYFGPADTNVIEQERKDFTKSDHADRQYVNSFSQDSIDGTSLKLSTLLNVEVSDAVFQETYITVARFNRLLVKLDNDSGMSDTNYLSLLEVEAGVAMNNSLADLVAKIKADDTGGTYSTPSGSNEFDVVRDEFNTLMDELNASVKVFFANYTKYTDAVVYESIITNIDNITTIVTVLDEVPFIQGSNIIYKGIASEIEYAPQHLGDVSLEKMFREATLMFDQFNFSSGAFTFRTDISDNYEGEDFVGEGNGNFGVQSYGDYTYGGYANQIPTRTWIPRNKMRCRFINVRFQHSGARESFSLTGHSLTYNSTTTERAYQP